MSETYAEIMARTPPIRWAMPEGGVTLAEITARNEYTLDSLKAAAEIVWACYESFENAWASAYDGIPDRDEGVQEEIEHCRLTLAHGGPRDASTAEEMRWRAVSIMNMPRVLASSSRVVEVPDA